MNNNRGEKPHKKENNNINNLEYVTHSENQFHSFRVLKRNPVKAWLGKRGEKHNKSIGVIAYNTITNEKKRYGSMRIAEEKTSISRVTIRKYINKNKPYKNILFYESKNNNS